MPTGLGTHHGISQRYLENRFIPGALVVGNAIAFRSGEVVMELLMLVGFAGAVILLGFLSCLAGGSSERNHMRGGRGDMPAPKWRTRR